MANELEATPVREKKHALVLFVKKLAISLKIAGSAKIKENLQIKVATSVSPKARRMGVDLKEAPTSPTPTDDPMLANSCTNSFDFHQDADEYTENCTEIRNKSSAVKS